MELISPTEFAKQKVLAVQEYTLLAAQSVANLMRKPLYFADMVQQADLIGVGSLPIVVLTGFFTGGVLALQTANTLQRFGSITLIGQLVSTSMVRELGPVLTGLMVAGRNSSGMASELGSMVVTEQIDAMRALGTDPMKKLVTPRVTATVFMLFFLSIISDLVGLAGGLMVAKLFLSLAMALAGACRLAGLRRRFHGAAETDFVRVHHRNDRMLLRNDCARRNAGCRPGHHASRSSCVRADSGH